MDSTDKAFTGALSHDPTAIWLALCEIQPNETARITASVRLFAEEKEGTLRKLMTKKEYMPYTAFPSLLKPSFIKSGASLSVKTHNP